MSRLPDLVLDSRLRTKFNDSLTVHSYLEIDDSGRRFPREERWKWDRFLGRGGFGQVRLQRCVAKGAKQDALRAVKIIHKPLDSSSSSDFNRELETITKFSNNRYKRWFVKSFGWFEDSSSIFITMEYCRYGDLQSYLKKCNLVPVGEVQQMAFQILEGLDQMHKNDFTHRDLKPGNILVKSMPPDEEWWIVLADFGISKRADETNGPTTAIKGTTTFMAPELQVYLESVKPKTIADFKATDMWALGEIIFQMLTGKATFQNPRDLMKYCMGQQAFPSERLLMFASDDGCEFVARIMMVLPQDRMTTRQCIQHRWMESLRVDEELTALDLEEHGTAIPEMFLNEPASARWSKLSDPENTTTQMTVRRKPVNSSNLVPLRPEQHRQERTESTEAFRSSSTLPPLYNSIIWSRDVVGTPNVADIEPQPTPSVVSPRRDLKSWWKQFSRKPSRGEQQGAIFGVPLATSIPYANVAIGESYIYGYVPIIFAKCAVFLKEKGTRLEYLFCRPSSEKVIQELKVVFDSPPRYGISLDWDGYTLYDAANILRLFFAYLPEPVIPFTNYDSFRRPLRHHQAEAVGYFPGQIPHIGGFDPNAAVRIYQQVIRELATLNRSILLYLLDLLAAIAAKSFINKMNTAALAGLFQPYILSHPQRDKASALNTEERRLSCDVLIFLIDNQDHFFFGMEETPVEDKQSECRKFESAGICQSEFFPSLDR